MPKGKGATGGDAQSRPSRMRERSRDWLEDINISDNSGNSEHVLSEPFPPHIVLSALHSLIHVIQPHEGDTIVIPILQMRLLSFSTFLTYINYYLCVT